MHFFVFNCWGHPLLLWYEKRGILGMRTTENCVFLNVRVVCHYYGVKMLRMRTTENCVFLNVRVACHYYGVKNVTHAHNRKLCVFKC